MEDNNIPKSTDYYMVIDDNKDKKPYVCPVCQGRGIVHNGFYNSTGSITYGSTSTAPEICRTCDGTGIVWG